MISRRKVVICGSFKQDLLALEKLYQKLSELQCTIISPLSLDFAISDRGFVKSMQDKAFSNLDIENHHLRSIAFADDIWIHAPNGYLGASTCFEIGYALALNKPIYCQEIIDDPTLKEYITLREL
ncbi:hypothetical protein KC878_02670 [Candidatus Saccharibacteria bacterium]|nr:hypothetical protein [Candidatus Saccharibacteria bacterium]MCB9820931.1 hypothetical protein [Candidatus Nomurabacteria bacterium]